MAYEKPQQWELDTVRGARPGVVAFRDCVRFWQPEIEDLGIYNRRPAGSSALAGRPVTVANASVHAVGRAWDPKIDSKHEGDMLAWRCAAAWPALGLCEFIWWGMRTVDGKEWFRYTGPDSHKTHAHLGFTIAMADNASGHDALGRWFSHFLYGIG